MGKECAYSFYKIEGLTVHFEEYDSIIFPIRRGANLPESTPIRPEDCDLRRVNKHDGEYIGGLNVYHNGFYDCFKVIRLGNLDEKIVEVLKRKFNNPLLRLLSRRDYGPKRLLTEEIVRKALPPKFVEEADKLKECTLCQTLFEDKEALSIVEPLALEILESLKN